MKSIKIFIYLFIKIIQFSKDRPFILTKLLHPSIQIGSSNNIFLWKYLISLTCYFILYFPVLQWAIYPQDYIRIFQGILQMLDGTKDTPMARNNLSNVVAGSKLRWSPRRFTWILYGKLIRPRTRG